MTTRRQLLLGSGAALAMLGLPWGAARATALPRDRKFVFVFNTGGWDPTRVFADQLANPNVDTEAAAARATAGGITYVAHPDRPAVSTFMERNHGRMVVMNGVLVRSIAHEICTMIALTGTSSGRAPDWPAVLAGAELDRYTLPHLVVAGPSFPGDLGVAVARTGTGGQLEALLSGEALDWSDIDVTALKRPSEQLVDRYLHRRALSAAASADSAARARLTADFRDAHAKATALADLQYIMDFTGGAELEDQARVAVEALTTGLSRCVTLAYPGQGLFGWDTHANNDADQSTLFEGLFKGLAALMARLDAAPGETEQTLAEETVVVVLSEMGRTPKLNQVAGKDHWPYTSVMLLGAGLAGDRVVGGHDENYYGLTVDPATGDVRDGAQVLSAEAVGATLLALADVDPGPYVSGVEPITGVIA